MLRVTKYKRQAQLADAATVIIAGLAGCDQISIVVDDSANLSVAQVTNSDDPNDAGALWSDISWTNNAAALSGPITGVKLTASGAAVDWSIVGTG